MFRGFFSGKNSETRASETQTPKRRDAGWNKGDTLASSSSQPKSLSNALKNLLANYKLSKTSDLRLKDVKGVLRLFNTEDIKLDKIDKEILNSGQFNTVDKMR